MGKKIVDLLAIALPFLLIVIGFMRVGASTSKRGSSRTRLLNVLTMFIAVVLLLIGVARYLFFPGAGSGGNSGPKPESIAVSKHSEAFNSSVAKTLDAYYKMAEGFVNWDTAEINKRGAELVTALEEVKTDELKKDTTKDAGKIYLTAVDFVSFAKGDATNIVQQPSVDKKRETLNNLTDNLRNLLITVKYDGAKLYYQECPMAFGDGFSGFWLSPGREVRNPYLGKFHPEYKDGMLACGAPKDSIDFAPPDTIGR